MKLSENYECDGQIEITDYLKSKVIIRQVMDLTEWINSHGKSQYAQIGEVIRKTYEREKDTDQLLDRLTNDVSVYVLQQSTGYMKYLREQSKP